VASNNEAYGGYAYEFISPICIAIKNYISRDPDGMMKVGEGQ